MQKNRFLWLTIPMVSALTAAGIVLLILREHTLIVLLVCYVLGAVIGDLLCDRDDGSWILSWIRARRQGKKEADAEYGSDHQTAARAANDARTYLLIRVIGGFFGLFFRLVTLAFVAAAVSVSWIVRVIVSLVGWIKAKPSEAAAPSAQAAAPSTRTAAPSAQADTASTHAAAPKKKQNKGAWIAAVVGAAVLLAVVLIGIAAERKQAAHPAAAEAASASATAPANTEEDPAAPVTEPAAFESAAASNTDAAKETAQATSFTAQPASAPTPTPAYLYGIPIADLDYVPTESEFFIVSRQLTTIVQGDMNVRSGPDKSYQKLSTLSFGKLRTAVAAKNDWFLVEYREGAYGWVSGKLTFGAWMFSDGLNGNLDGLTEPSAYLSAPALMTIVHSDGADLRTGPSLNHTLLDHCKKGLSVAVIAKDGDWYFINRSGQYGWIQGDGFSAAAAATNTPSIPTDTPQTIDTLGDGNYHILLSSEDDVLLSGSYYLIRVSLMKEYAFTQDEIDRASSGETVTVHGYTIASDIHMATEEEDTRGGATSYVAGGDEFCYNSTTGLYAVYPLGEGDAYRYSTGKAWARLSAEAEVVDRGHAEYCYDDFTTEERARFHITCDDEGGMAKAVFTADSLAAYLAVCKKHSGCEVEMEGALVIRNGIATQLGFSFYP